MKNEYGSLFIVALLLVPIFFQTNVVSQAVNITGTANATNPVTYGNYKLYAPLGGNNLWAKIVIQSNGVTVNTLVINEGDTKTSTVAGLDIKVVDVRALLDGTVVGADLFIESAKEHIIETVTPCKEGYVYSEALGTCVRESFDPGQLVQISVNLELLKTKFDTLSQISKAIADYYTRKDAIDKASKWNEISNDFRTLINDASNIQAYIRDNRNSLTDAILENIRSMVLNLESKIKDLLDKILSVSVGPISEKGILQGKIAIGPLCPVETFPPDTKCQPTEKTYKAWTIAVYTSDKKTKIAQIEPNLDGIYEVELPVGRYVVDLEKQQIVAFSRDLPAAISVNSGKTIILNIDIDTGIR